MRNWTLIIALIIGTLTALSAQRGGSYAYDYGNPGTRSNQARPYSNPDHRSNNGYGRGYGQGHGHGHGHGHQTNHHHHQNNHHHHQTNHHHHQTNVHHHYNNNNVGGSCGPVRPVAHGHGYNGYCRYTNHTFGWRPVCASSFNAGCRSIFSCGFDNDRLRAAKRFVRYNYVSAHQIAHIMTSFSFESTRLAFAKFAFHRTCDIQNYGFVFDALTFNSSRRELDCYIRDYHW